MITIPTLSGKRIPGGFKVFCDYCRRWHHHGGEPGHRVAHCRWRESPYWRNGYIVTIKPLRRRSA